MKMSKHKQAGYISPECELSALYSEAVLCQSGSDAVIDNVTTEDFTW